jgi:hypothetical protein
MKYIRNSYVLALEYWSSLLRRRSFGYEGQAGVMECWCGMLEYWNGGMMQLWSAGILIQKQSIFFVAKSHSHYFISSY